MMKSPVLLLFFLLCICSLSTAFSTPPSLKDSLKDMLSLKVISKDQQVIFFPTAGYKLGGGEYIIPIHGWIFDPEKRKTRRRAVISLLRNVVGEMLNGDNDITINGIESKRIVSRRLNPFIVDNHRRRKITVRFDNNNDTSITRELLERSSKNGHFKGMVCLSQDQVDALCTTNDGRIHYQAVTGLKDDQRSFVGECHILQPTGVSVISDIDDTVKITNVLDKKRLVKHTFFEEFKAVPGMAELFQRWKDEKEDASFHYVSSSPWQLYSEIANFFSAQGFPTPTSFALKSIRLKDRSLLNLSKDPMVSKISKISSIIETFPQRTFVLVGDTGERDPEVYGEICRRYPQQVERVFLRDVVPDLDPKLLQHVNEKRLKREQGTLTAPDRYEKAFQGVSDETWSLFTDANEIDY